MTKSFPISSIPARSTVGSWLADAGRPGALVDAVSVRRLAGDVAQVLALPGVGRVLSLAGYARLAQMLLALIAGGGMYAWCRRGMGLGFWPAVFAGWCYPVSAFFILQQGYAPTPVVAWLPWLLLAVEGTARRPLSWAGPAVALLTALAVLSGQLDIAGQVLLVSGIYGAVRLLTIYWKRWFTWPAVRSAVALGVAWLLGLCLAMPQWLPVVEYSRTGSRLMRRVAGEEERPPVGPSAVPLAVLPELYGCTQDGSFFLVDGNRVESASALCRPAGRAAAGAAGLAQPPKPADGLAAGRPGRAGTGLGGQYPRHRPNPANAWAEHDVAQPPGLHHGPGRGGLGRHRPGYVAGRPAPAAMVVLASLGTRRRPGRLVLGSHRQLAGADRLAVAPWSSPGTRWGGSPICSRWSRFRGGSSACTWQARCCAD